MIKTYLNIFMFLFSLSFYAQDYFPKNDGVAIRTNILTHAFIDGIQISLESHQTELWKRYSEKYKGE